MEVKTERLFIRPIEKEDAKAIFKYRSDSVTNKYQGWIPKALDDVYEFIHQISPKIDVVNTWFQLVIVENKQFFMRIVVLSCFNFLFCLSLYYINQS